MSTAQIREVTFLWLEERDKGNWNIIDELSACDYVCHLASDPEPIGGRDKVRRLQVFYYLDAEYSPTLLPRSWTVDRLPRNLVL